MQPADRGAFVATLNGLAVIKPGASALTPEGLDLWWSALQHWSIEEFKEAATVLARSVEFMPSPFHFEELRKAALPTVGEAWSSARAASASSIVCGRVTEGGSSGDAMIDAAVRAIGGYGAIAMCLQDKLPFLERRFAEHYESITAAQDVRDALPRLPALRHVSCAARSLRPIC